MLSSVGVREHSKKERYEDSDEREREERYDASNERERKERCFELLRYVYQICRCTERTMSRTSNTATRTTFCVQYQWTVMATILFGGCGTSSLTGSCGFLRACSRRSYNGIRPFSIRKYTELGFQVSRSYRTQPCVHRCIPRSVICRLGDKIFCCETCMRT